MDKIKPIDKTEKLKNPPFNKKANIISLKKYQANSKLDKRDKEQIKNKTLITELHRHEAVDRLFVTIDNISNNISKHPVIDENEKFKERVEKVMHDLFKILQDVNEMEI